VATDPDDAFGVDLTSPVGCVACVFAWCPGDARSIYGLDLDDEPAKGGAEAYVGNDAEKVRAMIIHDKEGMAGRYSAFPPWGARKLQLAPGAHPRAVVIGRLPRPLTAPRPRRGFY
jgi:hypothetical protein